MTLITEPKPISQAMASSLQNHSANYDHITLTDDEIKAALHHAKGQKDAKLKMEAYKKKLFEEPKYDVLDFDALKALVLKNHPEYVIDHDNQEIFDLLCQYFSNDPGFEFETKFSFKKGILLFGPIGCGKTSLMRMFGVNSFRPYTLEACRRISDLYAKNGSDALNHFSEMQMAYKHQNFGHTHTGRCFDDLGTEDVKKNYGNEINVMQDVLYKIYDNRLIGNFHVTTNLSGDEIEQNYGSRIKSRMREMFNIIHFNEAAPDRRK